MPEKKKIKRIILQIAGTLSLILGLIGVVLPVLPTTPFLLLTAACYVRSSDKLYAWLMNHKWFGEHIRNYREKKAIRLSSKVIALSSLWLTILYSIFFVVQTLFLQLLLAAIVLAVSAHILHFKTLRD